MKLISMTDFVLQTLNESAPNDFIEAIASIRKYAEFLKQPLTLGMFVPCDDQGNILHEPKTTTIQDAAFDVEEVERYNKAKEKVLFKGFYAVSYAGVQTKYSYVRNKHPHVFSFEQIERCNVEKLLTEFEEEYKIELTASAIKQIWNNL